MTTDADLLVRRPNNIGSLEAEIEALQRQEEERANRQPPADPPIVEDEVKEPETKEEITFKKRYGDLRRHSQKVETDLKAKIEELEKKISSVETKELPTTPEQVEAWVKKFPEVAAIVQALADEQATKKNVDVKERLAAIEEANTQIQLEREKAAIRNVHPDYDEISTDDDFHDWLEEQPNSVQNAIYDGNSKDVIWGLTQYKKEKGIKTAKAEKDAARSTGRKGTRTELDIPKRGRFSESEVQKMSMVDFEKNKDAIYEEMRNGTFVYDLSGGAR